MPRYDVPKEFKSEEKIVDGKLSLRQLIYVLAIVVVDIGLFFLLNFIPISTRLFILVPLTVIVLALAFFEHPVYGRLDLLLLRAFRYYRTGKIYR